MLRKLIAFSIQHAALMLVAAALLLVFTFYQIPRMAVDVFPELNAPTVVVLTEAGGLAADEVEQYVTIPLESAVNGLPGVRRVRSGSAMSLSLVYVEFDWGADIYRARQVVGEALSVVSDQLPPRTHTQIAPISGVTGEIMLLSLSSPDGSVSPLDLRAFAEYDLRQQLLGVQGVAQVVAIGGQLPEYQVNVNQAMLQLYGLTLDDVARAAGEAHSTASAGYLPDVRGQEIVIRQQAQVRQVADIRQTVIKHHNGAPVTLGQVAEVTLGATPPRGTAARAGEPAVVMSIKKAPFTNTLAITQDIDTLLDQIDAGLPEGMAIDRHVMRQADFIRASVGTVTHKLRDASIIVAVIVVLFLLNVRASIITLTAIPLSIAMGLLFLWGMDMTLNVMTLGGLAIAVGEVVDDAIIDVENILRRLRQNDALPAQHRRHRLRVIYDASNEIRSAIVFATVIIVIVFVPLLFLEGVEGRFFKPMGVAYISSILASLLVALTVVPALARYLFGREKRHRSNPDPVQPDAQAITGHGDSFLVRLLKRGYLPALKLAIRFRWAVMIGALLATLASLWLASTFGRDFLPAFNEGTFTLFIDAPPGTSLAQSDQMVRGLDRRISRIEGVRAVVRRTGRAERDEHAHGVNRSEVEISILPGFDQGRIRREIDALTADLPGLNVEIGSPISHQLSSVMSGTQAAIAINIFGQDLATLRQIAQEVEAALDDIPGTRDVLANRETAIESLPVRYRHADLARWGLTPADAAQQVETAFQGRPVQRINDGSRIYDLVVRLDPAQRRTPDDVRRFLLRNPQGALVRLSEVADIDPQSTPLGIQRENGRRKAVVSLNVSEGYNLGHVVAAVRQQVDPIVHRHGYTVTYGGQFEAQQSASQRLTLIGGLVCVIIFLLLTMAFSSARAALLVMVNLPLSLIGGIVAIFITQGDNPAGNFLALFTSGDYHAPVISIASMVGFITLFGIAVRNGLLLVKHYMHLMTLENRPFDKAVIEGSMERLVPILMTAMVATLGLAPLALAHGQPGGELLAPLAVVVLGGLVSSTFLNLFVVPAGYVMIFRKRQALITRRHDDDWLVNPDGAAEGTPSAHRAAEA